MARVTAVVAGLGLSTGGALALKTSGAGAAPASSACECLNWHDVYKRRNVSCGAGMELYKLRDMNKFARSVAKPEICGVFERVNDTFCMNVNNGNQPDRWDGGQWCYVSSGCEELNGGREVEGSNETLSWKICDGAAGDSLLRDMMPADLRRLSGEQDLDVRVLAKLAYPLHEAEAWAWADVAPLFHEKKWLHGLPPEAAAARPDLNALQLGRVRKVVDANQAVVWDGNRTHTQFAVVLGMEAYSIDRTDAEKKKLKHPGMRFTVKHFAVAELGPDPTQAGYDRGLDEKEYSSGAMGGLLDRGIIGQVEGAIGKDTIAKLGQAIEAGTIGATLHDTNVETANLASTEAAKGDGAILDTDDSCRCLAWKEVYASGKAACGQAQELSMLEGDMAGKPLVEHEYCTTFFETIDDNFCVNLDQASGVLGQRRQGQWCYVSAQCNAKHLNGGDVVEGGNVSWKMCVPGKDKLLRNMQPDALLEYSRKNDLGAATLYKFAYLLGDSTMEHVKQYWDAHGEQCKQTGNNTFTVDECWYLKFLAGSGSPMIWDNANASRVPFIVTRDMNAWLVDYEPGLKAMMKHPRNAATWQCQGCAATSGWGFANGDTVKPRYGVQVGQLGTVVGFTDSRIKVNFENGQYQKLEFEPADLRRTAFGFTVDDRVQYKFATDKLPRPINIANHSIGMVVGFNTNREGQTLVKVAFPRGNFNLRAEDLVHGTGDPCQCMNFRDTYDHYDVQCGTSGLEFFGIDRLPKAMREHLWTHYQKEYCDVKYGFFPRIDDSICLKVNQGSNFGSWCYVSSDCQHTNGGYTMDMNHDIKVKICRDGVDRTTRDMTPRQLVRYAHALDMESGLLAKQSYYVDHSHMWPQVKWFWSDDPIKNASNMTSWKHALSAVADAGYPVVWDSDDGHPPYGITMGYQAWELQMADHSSFSGHSFASFTRMVCVYGCDIPDPDRTVPDKMEPKPLPPQYNVMSDFQAPDLETDNILLPTAEDVAAANGDAPVSSGSAPVAPVVTEDP